MPKDALEVSTPVPPADPIAAALDRLAKIAESQQSVAQSTAKRLAPKSLEVGEIALISAFNPRGERSFAMPRLKCQVHAPWLIDPNTHGCTREEVELFNLLEPGVYPFELNDGTMAEMQITTVMNKATGAVEKMFLHPTPNWNEEHRQKFKAMTVILREILGDKATGVLSMKQEKTQIAKGDLAVSVNG